MMNRPGYSIPVPNSTQPCRPPYKLGASNYWICSNATSLFVFMVHHDFSGGLRKTHGRPVRWWHEPIKEHYRCCCSWICLQVDSVDLQLERPDGRHSLGARPGLICPECGSSCSQADLAPERTWRHLDTMQFTTELRARVPRSNVASVASRQ